MASPSSGIEALQIASNLRRWHSSVTSLIICIFWCVIVILRRLINLNVFCSAAAQIRSFHSETIGNKAFVLRMDLAPSELSGIHFNFSWFLPESLFFFFLLRVLLLNVRTLLPEWNLSGRSWRDDKQGKTLPHYENTIHISSQL